MHVGLCSTTQTACVSHPPSLPQQCLPGYRFGENGTSCVPCQDPACRYCQRRAFPPGDQPGGDLADVYAPGTLIGDDWVMLEVCTACLQPGWQPVDGACVPPPPPGTPFRSPEPVGGLAVYEPRPPPEGQAAGGGSASAGGSGGGLNNEQLVYR